MRVKNDQGMTLLEVMIAIGIFGIMMLVISQMLRAEIRLFNNEETANRYEQKARVAMNQVLNQIRIYGSVSLRGNGGSYDDGLYSGTACLLNLKPNPGSDPGGAAAEAEMYYLPDKGELWYRQPGGARIEFVIADHIKALEIKADGGSSRLVRIRIRAGGADPTEEFDLVTWARLY